MRAMVTPSLVMVGEPNFVEDDVAQPIDPTASAGGRCRA
jgi:hypothetical protein